MVDAGTVVRIKDFLGGIRGVISVDVNDQRILVVATQEANIPLGQLEGIQVIVRRSSTIRRAGLQMAMEELCFKCAHRPLIAGTSVGHRDVTAGTYGLTVYDYFGQPYILSNNHVIANGNLGIIGDPIYQPAPFDNGVEVVATLSKFVRLKYKHGDKNIVPDNLVDCALGRPVDGVLMSPEILGVGTPKGIAKAVEGMEVIKVGRTSGITKGKILAVDADVRVAYEGDEYADFDNQILTEPIVHGGDSGSALLDMSGNVVGLVFAGSDSIGVATPIERVLRTLQVSIASDGDVPTNTNGGLVVILMAAIGGIVI